MPKFYVRDFTTAPQPDELPPGAVIHGPVKPHHSIPMWSVTWETDATDALDILRAMTPKLG